METLESLKRELEEFTPQRFNTTYSNLIDVAQTTGKEYEILDALSFIADCNLMLDHVNETLKNIPDETPKNQPGETHCVMCAAKEESHQALKELNEKLVESYEEQRERVKTYEKIIENKEELIRILKGENGNPPDRYLKVCGK